MCRQLDPEHTLLTGDGSEPSPERLALDAYNGRVNDDERLSVSSLSELSQKVLSRAVDARTSAQLLATASPVRRAHLGLVSASGAGLWLHATPCEVVKLSNEPVLFVTMLRR